MSTRHINVVDDFPDLDAALAWAVQTLDAEQLGEVSIEIKWFSRWEPLPGIDEPEWIDRWSAAVSGVAP